MESTNGRPRVGPVRSSLLIAAVILLLSSHYTALGALYHLSACDVNSISHRCPEVGGMTRGDAPTRQSRRPPAIALPAGLGLHTVGQLPKELAERAAP